MSNCPSIRERPTRVEHHESNVLIEDCAQELFLVKPVGQVEAGEGEREAEQSYVRQCQHPSRDWYNDRDRVTRLPEYS